MAYRFGHRGQEMMFPASIEEYVPSDAPVRAFDAFVEALDLSELGLEWDPHRVGNSTYDPRTMLKLLVYGYSYGVRSSRKLERETHYNLSFIWLAGGLKPDHKTIAEFRRKHREALGRILKQSVRLCLELDLIAGNTLFVDGSKMRANASLNQQWTKVRCEKRLAKIDRRIEEILRECEQTDQAELTAGSLVRMNQELADQERLKGRVRYIVEQLQTSQAKTLNTTDPDCVRTHGRQGSHAGYNLQVVVDAQAGLIVHSDVVKANNDLGQLADQVEKAEAIMSRTSETVCADAGYCQYEDLERLDCRGIRVLVPSKHQAGHHPPSPFHKSGFRYQGQDDIYLCPAGQILRPRRLIGEKKAKEYRTRAGVCQQCPHFGKCTTDRKNGRLLVRYLNEELRERLARTFERLDSQQLYRQRQQQAERPFGHIKRNLHADHFLLRRLAGVRAEASLLATAFNITRLINLISVPKLIPKLAT